MSSAPKTHVALYKAWTAGDLAKAKQIQDLLSDADLAQTKLGVAGLKLATSHYFKYGSGKARNPLPSGNPTALDAQKEVLDKLYQFETSL